VSLPKLNSAYADSSASWLGWSVKGDIDRAPADFSGRVTDGPPTIEMIFLCLFKRICILKPEALLALMQMLSFMLYEALSFTPIKFIDPSNSMIVYPINPVNFFSKHLLAGKNKNLYFTFAFT
jgi:hypothetical protein